jgi:flavin reductase (DIM6/NTAB) family NADH-FMN oxidoreductase RutF
VNASEDPLTALAPALGRIPSGLFILTAGQGDTEAGLLTSWVQQCSFDPPRVTVAIKSGREVASLLQPGMPFTLNILAEGQTQLLGYFGKGPPPGPSAFAGLDVERPEGEAVVLRSTMGCLFCRSAGRFPAGDHEVYLGEVVGGRLLLPEARPYVHVRKSGLRY